MMTKPPPAKILHAQGQSRRPLLLISAPEQPNEADAGGKRRPDTDAAHPKRLLVAVQTNEARGYYIAEEVPLEPSGGLTPRSVGLVQALRWLLEVAQGGFLVPDWTRLRSASPTTTELLSLLAGTQGLEGLRGLGAPVPRQIPIFFIYRGQMRRATASSSIAKLGDVRDAADPGLVGPVLDGGTRRSYAEAEAKVRVLRSSGADFDDVLTYLEAYGYENKHEHRGRWGRENLHELWSGESDA